MSTILRELLYCTDWFKHVYKEKLLGVVCVLELHDLKVRVLAFMQFEYRITDPIKPQTQNCIDEQFRCKKLCFMESNLLVGRHYFWFRMNKFVQVGRR